MKKFKGKASNVYVNVGTKGKQKLLQINANREAKARNNKSKVPVKKKTDAEFNQMLSKTGRKNTNSKSYQSMKAQARQKQIAHDYPINEDEAVNQQIYKVPRTLDMTVLLLIFLVISFSNISFNLSLLRNDDYTPINVESEDLINYYDNDIKVHGISDFIYNNTLYDRISKHTNISDPILSNDKYYYDLNYLYSTNSKLNLNGKDYLVQEDLNSNPTQIISKSNNLVNKTYNVALNYSIAYISSFNEINSPSTLGIYHSVGTIINIKPNTYYTAYHNVSNVYSTIRYAFYNTIEDTLLYSNAISYGYISNGGNFLTPPNANYVVIQFGYVHPSPAIVSWTQLQLNEGTTALPYQPYFLSAIVSDTELEQINLYRINNTINEYVAYDARYIDTFNDLAKKDGWKIINGFKTTLNTLQNIGSVGNWALEKAGFAPTTDHDDLVVVDNRILHTLDYKKDYNRHLNDFDILPAQPYKDYYDYIYEIRIIPNGVKAIDPYVFHRQYKWVNNDWELIGTYNNIKTWEKTAHPIPLGYLEFSPSVFYSIYGKEADIITRWLYGWPSDIVWKPYTPLL